MLEEWQFCFHVKGLVAPTKGLTLDDMLIVGFPPSDEGVVFIKKTIDPNANKDEIRDEIRNRLSNFFQIYSLINNCKIEVITTASGYGKITDEHPYGNSDLTKRLKFIPVFDEVEREEKTSLFINTMIKYNEIKDVFYNKKKAFLRNAIDYYLRSIGDKRKEEKLLDLTICLESLFSNELDELGLRYSLRVSALLSVGQETKRPMFYKNIRFLYGKRSEVVHGKEEVELNDGALFAFQMFMKEAIKRLIYIDMPKQDIIKLLDESIYDTNKVDTLNELVKRAMEKW